MLLLFSYTAFYLNPDYFWFISILGLAYPILLIINLAFVVMWLLLLHKNILLSLIVILIGWNHLERHFQLPHKNETTDVSGFSIMSFNVQGFHYQDKDYIKGIYSLADSIDADIICFQEFFISGKNRSRLKKNSILSKYKYKRIDKKFGGLITLSKEKIINSGFISIKNSYPHAVFHDIITDKDTIRIYNLQLKSIKLNSEKEIFNHLADLNNEKSKKKIITILKKLKIAFQNRPAQVDAIIANFATCPYPYMVAGDFNVTPLSYTYQKLSSNLTDPYIEQGSWFGNTHNENLPPIRIDYILHNDNYRAMDFKVLKTELSDHYPIITVLSSNNN